MNSRFLLSLSMALIAPLAVAADYTFPIFAPLTGPGSIEGASQRNGALLAMMREAGGKSLAFEQTDTGGAAEGGVNALEKYSDDKKLIAIVAPPIGAQMMAVLPLGLELKVPMVTVSGTGTVTEQGNPYVFRFYPSDAVAKHVQVRYAVKDLGLKRVAVLFNATAYGQSGMGFIGKYVTRDGGSVVYQEDISLSAKDLSSTVTKVVQAKPDVILLQMHAASGAILLRQLAAVGSRIPVVASTTMALPSAAALLEPEALKGVCAETASVGQKGQSPQMDEFIAAYEKQFSIRPDAFAIQQYDGVAMALAGLRSGAATKPALRDYLAANGYKGLAMTYKTDGKGNMAHSAILICYDGVTRDPKVVARFNDVDPTK